MKMATVATPAPASPPTRYPMNAAVITTGPGVISPMATASRNCRCVNQWCWLTTPSRRNGTMARPLPKMNAPALRKNRRHQRAASGEARQDLERGAGARHGHGRGRRPSAPLMRASRRNRGGASTSTMSRPAPTNSRAISAPVTAVITRMARVIAQSFGSRLSVRRASLTTATAMIAMTA